MESLHNSEAIYSVEHDRFFSNLDELLVYLKQHPEQMEEDFELLIAPVLSISEQLIPDLASKRAYYFRLRNGEVTLIGNSMWSQY